MKIIKKWRNIFALVFIICFILTIYFVFSQAVKNAVVFGFISTLTLIRFIKQYKLYCDAKLICDNCILSVPLEQTIMSNFGLLIRNKVYKWGTDGVRGNRLTSIKLDSQYIYLTFGTKGDTLLLKILHGITDSQQITDLTEKLWYETGVQTEIHQWPDLM